MNNHSFENNNNLNENKPSKLFEYMELVNKMIENVSSLEQDWTMFEEEIGTFPHTERGVIVIEFIGKAEIADGSFIRNFYDDLMDFLESEELKGDFKKIKKFVNFNFYLKESQKIIWELGEKKDSLVKSMKNMDIEKSSSVDNKELIDVGDFYLQMKSLNMYLKQMMNIFNNEINK